MNERKSYANREHMIEETPLSQVSADKRFLEYVFFQTSNSVDQEQAQALARIAMSLLVFLLLGSQTLWLQTMEAPQSHVLAMTLVYLLVSILYFFFVSRVKQHFLWRRYVVIVTDLLILSLGTYLLDNSGFSFYPLFLWVVIGNGLRFGVLHLKIATLVGVVCFSVAIFLNGSWHELPEVSIGLLLGLLILPKVFLVLISKLSEANSQLHEHIWQAEFAANHDALTNLPNKLLFNARLEHALEHAQQVNRCIAVLFLDLDNFKAINDGLGHPVGDKVLQAVASHLTLQVREDDTVARIAGDLFAIILEEVNNSQDVANVAKKILSAFETPLKLDDRELHISTTIGISLYPEDGTDVTTLARNSDAAVYQAKERGRNRYCFYTQDLTETALERLHLENELRMALKRKEFTIYYQPQYSLVTGELTGAEALLRWQHPQNGLISPAKFIPVVESTGLIVPLGEWVLREACAQTKAWHKAGYELKRIGVNVSGQQIQWGNFAKIVQKILKETELDPQCLELEITESFIMQQADEAISTLEEIRKLGVHIAIDDFGTGYSSLSYLNLLPIDKLKVDKSFVKNISQESDKAIAKAVIALARSLQLKVIAEGVETKEQETFLNSEGCDEVQGYYYSRPVPENDFVKFLSCKGNLPRSSRNNLTGALATKAG